MAPIDTLNGILTGYDVAFRDVSADSWSTLTVDSPVNSVSVSNLSLFVTYEFKVRSVNRVGVSEYSRPLTHFTELGLSIFFFLPMRCYASTVHVMALCLSVCLSHVGIVSKQLK